jgi:hypothetical protein
MNKYEVTFDGFNPVIIESESQIEAIEYTKEYLRSWTGCNDFNISSVEVINENL